MAMITTKDSTQIFYKDWGPKDAQPIVFHHGWGRIPRPHNLPFDDSVIPVDYKLGNVSNRGKGRSHSRRPFSLATFRRKSEAPGPLESARTPSQSCQNAQRQENSCIPPKNMFHV